MIAAKLIVIIWLYLLGIGAVLSVGEERKPVTPSQAAWLMVVSTTMVALVAIGWEAHW